MNKTIQSSLLVLLAALFIVSCKKEEQRAILNTSSATSTLAASSSTMVLDSSQKTTTALTLTTKPVDYGYKAAVNYTLQFDSANGNFDKADSVALTSNLTQSYTVADLNALVLSLGLTPGNAGTIKARVKAQVNQVSGSASSIPTVYSNVVTLTITPYSTKPVPLFPVPDSLYIVGDATPGGWANPVPTPSQKFTKIDDNTFGIVLPLIGGKQYLLLPKNGDWGHKYAVPGTPDPMAGSFMPDEKNNIPGPATDGVYTIIVDFLKGTYTLTAGNPYKVPSNLYIVGDATAGGWGNPVPTPSQQFTQTSNGEFSLTIPLTAGKSYLFLPLNGNWDHKFGGADKLGGTLLADGNVPGSNTPAPDASDTYTIYVNFFTKQYTVTK